MLPLAHLGIGSNLVRPWWKKLDLRALLFGTLLPDLIDKPLYHVPALLTGLHGYELGLISGTRSVAHSLLFLGLLLLFALVPGGRRRWWLSVAVGVATHLLLDNGPEALNELSPYSGRIALLFPYFGWRFPLAKNHSMAEHFLSHLEVFDLCGEVVGAALLAWMWKARTRPTRGDGRPASTEA